MSKMSNLHIQTADQRAEDNERLVTWLQGKATQMEWERDAWRSRYWWLTHGQLMREGHPNEVAAMHADAKCAEMAKCIRDFPPSA